MYWRKKIAWVDDEPTREFRLDLMRKIHQCASEQGQGASSLELGSHLQISDRFDEAVKGLSSRHKKW